MGKDLDLQILLKAKDMASREIKNVSKSLEGMDKTAGRLSGGLEGILAGVAGAYAAVKVAEFTWELGKLGAESLDTKASFDSMLRSVGQSPALLGKMKASAGGTIAELQLMQGVNTALAGTSGQLSAALADAQPKLLEVARAAYKANPALGSVAYQYQSLNLGIKRLQPKLIDNAGLTLTLSEVYGKYAEKIGKATAELTSYEQQMALIDAVTGDVGQRLIDQVGGIEAMGDAYAELDASMADLKASWGELMAEPMAKMAKNFTDMLRMTLAVTEGNWKLVGAQLALSDAERKYADDASETNKALVKQWQARTDLASGMAIYLPLMGEGITVTKGLGDAAAEAATDVEALAAAIQAAMDAAASFDPLAMSMQDLMETPLGGILARGGRSSYEAGQRRAAQELEDAKTDIATQGAWDRAKLELDSIRDTSAQAIDVWEKAHQTQRSTIKSIMSTFAQPFDGKSMMDQMGRHIDTWDENRSRMIDVANLGFGGEGQWHDKLNEMGFIPDEVLQGGEEVTIAFAANWVLEFDRGEHPEAIDMEALERQIQEAVDKQANWEQIYTTVQTKLGLSDTEMNLARGIYDPVQQTIDASRDTLDKNYETIKSFGSKMFDTIMEGVGASSEKNDIMKVIISNVIKALTGGGYFP